MLFGHCGKDGLDPGLRRDDECWGLWSGPVRASASPASLILEQRRHRHWMRAPTGDSLARVRAIVEAIRARVPPGTPT